MYECPLLLDEDLSCFVCVVIIIDRSWHRLISMGKKLLNISIE